MSEATNGAGVRTTDTVLDRIVARRRGDVARSRHDVPESHLGRLASELPGARVDFAERLRRGRAGALPGARLRLVAEIKRASPSKGVFDADLDAAKQARAYADAGASAVSVLTEPNFFRGSLDDLRAARTAFGDDADRPALLRKDFIFDAYQVLEARAHGADALLLIAMMLTPEALRDLLACTREHGLEALVEVHNEEELATAVEAGATVLGVNNRDLRTFSEDLGTFERLAALAPPDVVLVAESAIKTAADAERMRAAGAHALLVGEALVLSGDIDAKAGELLLAGSEVAS